MAEENKPFNILKHRLVPDHILLTEEEAEAVLKDIFKDDNVIENKKKLPKIRKDDPAIKALENTDGNPSNIEPGSVIKVVRDSETADQFVAYRVVVVGGDE